MLTLADVIDALVNVQPVDASISISEAVVDSRKAIPGSLFVAIPGTAANGHQYLAAAFQNGALFALIQQDVSADIPVIDLRRPWQEENALPHPPFAMRVDNSLKALQKIAAYWRKKNDIRIIGITGSVGKSTTKELVAEVLAKKYRTLKNTGNYNNEVGLPLTLLRLGPGYERAVLEMGFYKPGEIKELCDIATPQVGILTNIGTVHASRSKSQEAIAAGKSELVQALPPSPVGTAILNKDDPWIVKMAELTDAKVIYYGMDSSADLWADDVESLGLDGIRFTLHYSGEQFRLRVPIIGRHSIQTVLRATAAGIVEGIPLDLIFSALRESTSQLRLVASFTQQGALLLDDTYNASPESMLAALNMLEDLPGRKIAVLGGMNELGPYELAGHQKVGQRVAEIADRLIAFQDNAKMISAAALEAGMPPESISTLDDPKIVVSELNMLLKKNDIVLFKGAHSLKMDSIVQALEIEG